MTSAVNIQIVSMPNLAKIENFFKDVSYLETIEYSANFNTRLCIERRLRLPFLDPQTGVAQNHSQLFMDKRQRMPGFRQGQIYTYPATRWRKTRRQYLAKIYRFPERPFQALRKEHEALLARAHQTVGVANPGGSNIGSVATLDVNLLTGGCSTTPTVLSSLYNDPTHDLNCTFSLEESSSLGAVGGDTSDSKDSQTLQIHNFHSKDDLSKEWFYDDIDMNDVDSLEEPKSPADDEYDYDPRYGSKKRRKRRPGKRTTTHTNNDVIALREASGRRRSIVPRTRVSTTDAALDASLEAIESGDITGPLTPGPGRRLRTVGTRGRRRPKGPSSSANGPGGLPSNSYEQSSPIMANEPPSFETAAAAVSVTAGVDVEERNTHLRNYRKYI